jgi:perosamine synthetase
MTNIPVYRPYLHGNERKYLNECIDSSWISSKGGFLIEFERHFQDFVGAPYALSVCNGTAALHLALLALNIQPGDEVLVPSLTYVAPVNAIIYIGAVPVFADSLASSWQMDPADVLRKITPKTKAILAVHLYGHPCDIEALQEIAVKNKLFLIEDCAEAFGAYFKNIHVGNFGDVSTFSFFGNKTITTGEGGMITVRDKSLYQKISILKNQGGDPERTYWHSTIGYNYRMTNLSAAIGLAQIEQAASILKKKRILAQKYREGLRNLPLQMHEENPGCVHSHWMVSILLHKAKHRDPLRRYLSSVGIETRPFFHPIHRLPMYENIESGKSCPVAENLSSRGINLPSFPDLTDFEVSFICEQVAQYFTDIQNLWRFSAVEGTPEALPMST